MCVIICLILSLSSTLLPLQNLSPSIPPICPSPHLSFQYFYSLPFSLPSPIHSLILTSSRYSFLYSSSHLYSLSFSTFPSIHSLSRYPSLSRSVIHPPLLFPSSLHSFAFLSISLLLLALCPSPSIIPVIPPTFTHSLSHSLPTHCLSPSFHSSSSDSSSPFPFRPLSLSTFRPFPPPTLPPHLPFNPLSLPIYSPPIQPTLPPQLPTTPPNHYLPHILPSLPPTLPSTHTPSLLIHLLPPAPSYPSVFAQHIGCSCLMTEWQVRKVNGWSNRYYGWGAEDDDMYRRIRAEGMELWRFPKYSAAYTTLEHPQAAENPDR